MAEVGGAQSRVRPLALPVGHRSGSWDVFGRRVRDVRARVVWDEAVVDGACGRGRHDNNNDGDERGVTAMKDFLTLMTIKGGGHNSNCIKIISLPFLEKRSKTILENRQISSQPKSQP